MRIWTYRLLNFEKKIFWMFLVKMEGSLETESVRCYGRVTPYCSPLSLLPWSDIEQIYAFQACRRGNDQ